MSLAAHHSAAPFPLLLAVALVAGAAYADPVTDPVTIDVQVAHASNTIKPARVDPDCRQLQRQLPMRFNHLTTQQKKKLDLKMGQAGTIQLPSGRPVRFIPISIVEDRLHMHLGIRGLVETRLQLQNGKAVIVGGEKDASGGRIIVLVRPSFTVPAPSDPPAGPRLHRVGLQD